MMMDDRVDYAVFLFEDYCLPLYGVSTTWATTLVSKDLLY